MTEPKIRFKQDDGSDFPEWEEKTLGELGCFTKGASLSKADISDDGNPFVLYGELYTTYNEVAYEIKRKTQAEVDKKYYSKVGDVVIPTSGESPEEISTATCIMVPNVILAGDLNIYRSEKIDGRVISYIINHQAKEKIARIAQGKSVVHIQAKQLEKIEVSYPTDEKEQQKIADFLSSVDEVIATSEEEVANLEKQKKAAMQKIFSQEVRFKKPDGSDFPEWEEKEMRTIATVLMGQSPSGDSVNDDKNGVPLVQGKADILGYGIIPERYTSSPTKISEATDIIMTVRAPVGFVAKLGFSACIGRGVCAIRPNNCADYIFYVLQSKESEWKHIEQGSTFTAVNSDDVSSLIVPFPCLEEQQLIADFFTSFDEAITAAKQELEKWKLLKKGLLQKMFV